MRRVCLVGAGFIAQIHAEALAATKGVRLQAVVDPDRMAAKTLAARWRVPRIFASTAEALAAGEVDCAHVLTPPGLHAETALPFLEAGLPTLVEKPLAADAAQCRRLDEAARKSSATLAVNQNFVHHPAFLRLRQAVESGRLGRLRTVSVATHVPLRQLESRQFGHWMFAAPGNILLEQAVHPLSQIVALAGRIEDSKALAAAPQEIAPGLPFHSELGMLLQGARATAELRMAVGRSFPFWQVTAVCDDGVAVADILANRLVTHRRTRFIDPLDNLLAGCRAGGEMVADSLCNITAYALSTLRLKPRSDAFYLSMLKSIGAFHHALDHGRRPELDGGFGAHLVEVCEAVAAQAFTVPAAPRPLRRGDGQRAEICVLGGTGFIGTHVVRKLVAEERRVAVMARHARVLPALFHDERVTVVDGNVRDQAAVERAIGEARVVINLAHGGGGGNWPEIRAAMVGSAETVARACLARGVTRLVHVGSIAGLYLGPQSEAVTGMTPPDPLAERRGDYARAKAEADRLLMDLHLRERLPVVILRPGLVVGEGGPPFHTGLGFFNAERHCIGWNAGTNPLPFVLAEDVAEAVRLACTAPELEGRCYNLVGGVRLSAREYLAELAKALGRPLRFHPKTATGLWLEDLGKWAVKRAGGRNAPLPSRRDLVSRGLMARFDCTDAERDLGWRPEADRAKFVERAIGVQGSPSHKGEGE